MVAMVLQDRQDSVYFDETYIDSTLKSPLEGGYTHTRRRYTRGPLRHFKTGFTDLSDAEKTSLMTFYDSHRTDQIFQWTHPITLVEYDVRFESPINPRYSGRGGYHRWMLTDIVLIEA